MVKYLKIGNPKAHTFNDVTTGVNISNKQVIRLKNGKDINKPFLQAAIATRHIAEATEDEYNDYLAGVEKLQQASPKVEKVVTETKIVITPAKPPAQDDDDEDDTTNNDDDDDDDDDEELSKSELIDLLKESPLVNDKKKAKLTTLTHKQLQKIYDQVKPK